MSHRMPVRMPALPPKTDIKSAPNQNLWLYGFGSQVVTVALLGLLESDPVPASVAREPRQTGCASVFEIGNHQSLLSLRW